MMQYELRNVRKDKVNMIIFSTRQEIQFYNNKRIFVKISTRRSGIRMNKIKTRLMYRKNNFVKVGRQYRVYEMGVI